MPEMQPDTYERTVNSQFREIYGHVERIFALTDTPDLMSFGPMVVDRDGAIEDGWLELEKDFQPMLRAVTVPAVAIEINGAEYNSASFFFKQGGNQAADKLWLGDVFFMNDADELEYKLHTDGRIKLTKRTNNSRWISFCWAQVEEKRELNNALTGVKEHLHACKVGETSLG